MRYEDLDTNVVTRFESVLHTVCMISLRASAEEIAFGHPCSGLIDHMLTEGLKAFTKGLIESCLDRRQEFKFNGAGLKMWTTIVDGKIYVTVGGDQFDCYPVTGPKIRDLFKSRGYTRSLPK